MDTQPLTIRSWPQAILHLDADAFFTSCEQALHPELRGRPVITGKERGIVAAASYEAKAKGIKRGMRLFEVKEVCPEAIILPSDYEIYSLFSVRMFGPARWQESGLSGLYFLGALISSHSQMPADIDNTLLAFQYLPAQ